MLAEENLNVTHAIVQVSSLDVCFVVLGDVHVTMIYP